MKPAYVVTGTMSDNQTIALDEPLALDAARVRLVIEPLTAAVPRRVDTVMQEIWRSQERRGHVPPTKAEVDAWIEAERGAWDE
jgi:hypothetical protein